MSDKQLKITKILSYAKGKFQEKSYGRNFVIEQGILILNSEIETPGNPETVSFISKVDNIPINEFQSKVENNVFKPTVQFMNKLSVKHTSSFANKYLIEKRTIRHSKQQRSKTKKQNDR